MALRCTLEVENMFDGLGKWFGGAETVKDGALLEDEWVGTICWERLWEFLREEKQKLDFDMLIWDAYWISKYIGQIGHWLYESVTQIFLAWDMH